MLTIAPLENLHTPPRGGVPPRLKTTELNHLLTMFTQKFYEAIKGFQFLSQGELFMLKKALNHHKHIKEQKY